MRYRLRTGNALLAAMLLLVVGFIVRLFVERRLVLYIHPRYVWFAGCMAVVAALLCAYYTLTFGRTGTGQVPIQWRKLVKFVPAVLLLAVALLTPQRSLSANAARVRGLSQAPVSGSGVVVSSSLDQFGASVGSLSFRDWSVVLGSSQDAKVYVGKHTTLTGFVAPTAKTDANSFYLSRFFITCCAVDATPIGVKIMSPAWQNTYKPGQWLIVTAVVRAHGPEYALEPTSVKQVPEPEQPYAN